MVVYQIFTFETAWTTEISKKTLFEQAFSNL